MWPNTCMPNVHFPIASAPAHCGLCRDLLLGSDSTTEYCKTCNAPTSMLPHICSGRRSWAWCPTHKIISNKRQGTTLSPRVRAQCQNTRSSHTIHPRHPYIPVRALMPPSCRPRPFSEHNALTCPNHSPTHHHSEACPHVHNCHAPGHLSLHGPSRAGSAHTTAYTCAPPLRAYAHPPLLFTPATHALGMPQAT
jgi:hypothetical protein